MLASFLLGAAHHGKPWLVRRLLALYTPALAWSLRHPLPVIGVAVALLLGAGAGGGAFGVIL